jgi:hypothetical protein
MARRMWHSIHPTDSHSRLFPDCLAPQGSSFHLLCARKVKCFRYKVSAFQCPMGRFNACIQSMHIIPLVESKPSVVWVGVNKLVLSGAAVLRITKGALHSPFCIPISPLIGKSIYRAK